MGKQRTVAGPYSAENFNDGNKDKIRNTDIGPKADMGAIKSYASAIDANSSRNASFAAPITPRAGTVVDRLPPMVPKISARFPGWRRSARAPDSDGKGVKLWQSLGRLLLGLALPLSSPLQSAHRPRLPSECRPIKCGLPRPRPRLLKLAMALRALLAATCLCQPIVGIISRSRRDRS
jgi:hypothetical protein